LIATFAVSCWYIHLNGSKVITRPEAPTASAKAMV